MADTADGPYNEDHAPPDALDLAYRRLIVDILFHAIKDCRESAESVSGFADEDHRDFCIDLGFRSGADELRNFACTEWFNRLFIELHGVNIDDVKDILMKKCCAD